MKNRLKYIIFGVGALVALATGCKDYLVEEPKSLLTAQYLESQEGVEAALNSAYSSMRLFYGVEGPLNMTCSGTDEWQRGPDGSVDFNMYTSSLSANGQIGNAWGWGYQGINTCNAVIKFASTCGLTADEAKIKEAEARYIRASWYFIIVQLYGDCPLNLDFITEPSTEAHRDPVADIYTAIVDDLKFAKENLPAEASQTGRTDAAAATHLLAKVYLTRATNATAKQATDYQNAYDNAMELINNSGTYGLALLDDVAKVFENNNEHNSEVLFTVEHNTDETFGDIKEANSNYKSNQASYFFRPHYQVCTDYGGLARTIEYGRPWIRVRPTNYLLDGAFADKTYDVRYKKFFQTVWLVNDEESLTNPGFKLGDTAIWLPGTENYTPGKNIMNTYPPSRYYDNILDDGSKSAVKIYPSLNKFDDLNRDEINDPSTRPFIVHRFAETYLIAAEAAMYLGDAPQAVNLLSVIRTRASYDPDRSAGDNAFAKQRLLSQIPSMTDFDEGITFILDERMRELCGEYVRRFDLIRTFTTSGQCQLLYRLRNLVPEIPCKAEIKDYHVLYPIPQSQIDLTSNPFGQNDGY